MTVVILLNVVLCGAVVLAIDGLLLWAVVTGARDDRGHGRLAVPRPPQLPVVGSYVGTTGIDLRGSEGVG